MAATVAALRTRFGSEDFDSGPVAGCAPGNQNRWLRWGRLQVGFSTSAGVALFSEWQYPVQSSSPDFPPPPTTGGPDLTTARGLGPAGPPRSRAAIMAAFGTEWSSPEQPNAIS